MPEAITYNSNRNSSPVSASHHGGSGTGISGTSGAACEAASLGGFREAVCLNAGASLYITGKTGTIEEGVTMAERLIDSGAAAAKLEEFIRESNA